MIRNPRRAAEPESPAEISFARALEFETSSWPAGTARREFWSRPDIPAELQNGSEPDPRPVLAASARQVQAYRTLRERWTLARLEWLEAQAEGERDG